MENNKGKYSTFAIMIIFATVLGIIILINARMQLKEEEVTKHPIEIQKVDVTETNNNSLK
jgi:hypothetical protein